MLRCGVLIRRSSFVPELKQRNFNLLQQYEKLITSPIAVNIKSILQTFNNVDNKNTNIFKHEMINEKNNKENEIIKRNEIISLSISRSLDSNQLENLINFAYNLKNLNLLLELLEFAYQRNFYYLNNNLNNLDNNLAILSSDLSKKVFENKFSLILCLLFVKTV